jgi:hypothetical protein
VDQPPKRPDPPPAGASTSKSGFDRYAATAGAGPGPGGGKVVVEGQPVKKVDQQTGKTETIPTDKKTILPEVKVEGTKPAPAQVRAEASTFTKMVATAGDFLGRLMGEGKTVKLPGQPEPGSLRPNNPKDVEFPLLGEGRVERKPGAPEAGSTRQTDSEYAVRVGLEAGSALAPAPGSRAFTALAKAEAKVLGAEARAAAAATKTAAADGKAAASAEGKAASAEGKAASSEGKAASADGKAKPADGPTPAKPDDKPAAAKAADGSGPGKSVDGPAVVKPVDKPAAAKAADGSGPGKPADGPAAAKPGDGPVAAKSAEGAAAGKPTDGQAAKGAVPGRRNEARDRAAWEKAAADDKAAKGARPWARSDEAKAADKLESVRASQGGVDKAASYKGGGASGDAVKTGTPGTKEKVATADKGMSVKGSELREKGTRLPRDGGWDGKPGESKWVSRSADVNDITHSRPVPFKNQAPELKPWAQGQVNLKKMTGDNAKDMPAARQDLMRQNPGRWDSAAHVARWEKGAALDNRGKGLAEPHTWHHEPDRETMTLVPRALHDGLQHTGGASAARAGQGPDRSTAPLDSNPH